MKIFVNLTKYTNISAYFCEFTNSNLWIYFLWPYGHDFIQTWLSCCVQSEKLYHWTYWYVSFVCSIIMTFWDSAFRPMYSRRGVDGTLSLSPLPFTTPVQAWNFVWMHTFRITATFPRERGSTALRNANAWTQCHCKTTPAQFVRGRGGGGYLSTVRRDNVTLR